MRQNAERMGDKGQRKNQEKHEPQDRERKPCLYGLKKNVAPLPVLTNHP